METAMTEIYGPLPDGMTRATDFSATVYENQAVALIDLLRGRIAQDQREIRGVTFRNCRLEGPGVALVLDCRFEACDFGNPNGDIASLVLRPVSSSFVVGTIPVAGCSFTGCQFVGLGYTGSDAFLDQLLALGAPQ